MIDDATRRNTPKAATNEVLDMNPKHKFKESHMNTSTKFINRKADSNIADFTFNSSAVRVINKDGEAWFVAKDILASSKSKTKVTELEASIREGLGEEFVNNEPLQTAGGVQNFLVIHEAAVTFFVSRSRTEAGKKLNRLIHVEILPTIRKTGSYTLTISPKQQYLLKEAATLKAAASRKTHQAVWREFYQAFEIPKYQDLPASQFEEALAFLNGERLQKQQHVTQNDQERIGQAFAMAAEVANKVSRTVFEALMIGGDKLTYNRWVFSLGTDQSGNLNPQVKPVKNNAVIAPLAELPRYVLDHGLNVSNKELANLATACSQRLAERMTLEAREEKVLVVG